MPQSGIVIAVLDACVLYPAPLRDLLLSLAFHDLYIPKWSHRINDEWKRNVLKQDKAGVTADKLNRTVALMNTAFEDAQVDNIDEFERSLALPDKNDNHVLATAIACHADVIVTANLKDFPREYLNRYNIAVHHPDSFICSLIDRNQIVSKMAFLEQVERLENPPMKPEDVLAKLRDCGLKEASNMLYDLIFPGRAD